MRPLEEIEAMAAAASTAPWAADLVWSDHGNVDVGYPEGDDRELTEHLYISVAGPNRDANAVFIAHARQDVPDLVAEVRRLRELLDSATNHC